MGKERKNFTFPFISSYIYEMTLAITIFYALSEFVLGTLRNMEYCTQYVLPFNITLQALPGSR